MSSKTDTYEVVTDRIIEALEAGHIPWSKPWRSVSGEMPTSLQTGRGYRGINVWILSVEAMLRGYSSPYWATFKQAKERAVKAAQAEGREVVSKGKFYVEIVDGVEQPFLGGVRKGEKGTQVVLWKPIKKDVKTAGGDSVEERKFLLLKHFTVFNAEQCDGLDLPEMEPLPERDPIEACETIARQYVGGPEVKHGGNRAFYAPALDYVQMPQVGQFIDSENYYHTLFHELAHSTGHVDRLKRPEMIAPQPFGSEDYSKEELVAEMSAAFLSSEAGIEVEIEHSAGYIQSWLKALKDDRKMLVQAAAQAQKASDHILGRKPIQESKPTEEPV